MDKTVFISVLTRNHGKFLPHYFRSLEEMDYDKKNIVIYINTNNNDDDTMGFLTSWIGQNYFKYRNIIFEKGIDDPKITKDLYWDHDDNRRLKKMASIRNRSLDICRLEKTDYYFVMDTDNWVAPITLKYLIQKEKPIIAPFIKLHNDGSMYSNYFNDVTETGYYKSSPLDMDMWRRESMVGTFKVPLVHCTYLIDTKYINDLSYTSSYWGDHHYEFVLFANNAREKNVDQYICNEKMFGFVNYGNIIDEPNCYDLLLKKYYSDNKIDILNIDTH